MTPPPLIALCDLNKTYSDGTAAKPVFTALDLEVEKGEFLVLLGRSGSGKSTLLNLIAGLDNPSSGKVLIDGVELSALADTERTLFRRRHIGFVFQAYSLIPTLSVRENLSLPLEINQTEAIEANCRIVIVLEALALSDTIDRFPEQLSGGEQQRVAIARALVHDPSLILADEPTGNLDLETSRQVLSMLEQVTRSRNKTLIMATHSLEVLDIADRVLTVRDGKLVEVPPR